MMNCQNALPEHFCKSLRRGRDLNSRDHFWPAAFRKRSIQPLWHLSNKVILTFFDFFTKNVILTWLFWLYRLTVRTRPFQGWNRGSIPRRVTEIRNKCVEAFMYYISVDPTGNRKTEVIFLARKTTESGSRKFLSVGEEIICDRFP